MTTPLELLAPAKNAALGMAAIDHGADAVYIGAPQFSARAEAGSDVADISRLIRHAHLYYARVYVALNTILTDAEIPQARDIIHTVYEMGADGLIIQDVGLLELDLPPIPLIASTQMHNDTPEKVKFLEGVGFSRVILARELSCEEIGRIRRETAIELESFVHGALCVSYSGQCYMSQAVAQRSGNRGVCAQPCRSRYTLSDRTGNTLVERKFLLSLKDLNLSNHISDLVDAGVTAFKIEGRLKEIDYVKNVVAAYRMAIDDYIQTHPGYGRASSGSSTHTFSPDLDRTFNRGYTPYFIDGRKEKIASFDTQKAIGQSVGTVTATGKDFFEISGSELENGDGLCFFNREKNLVGFRVDQVREKRIYPNSMQGLRVGTRLFRNHDHAFCRALKKRSAKRQIALEIRFEQNPDGIRVAVTDEDGHQSHVDQRLAWEPANHPERMKEQIHTHLSRTGDTPYTVARVSIRPGTPGFIPLSTLNEIRRNALDHHTRIRLEACPRTSYHPVPNSVPYPQSELTHTANILNDHAEQFYRRHGVRRLERAFETLADPAGKTVMTTRYCIRHQLDACFKMPKNRRMLEAPLYIDDGRHRYRLEFDCKNCRMHVVLEGPIRK
ncbi:peptidase U32 family protein [Desulfosarcina ovata]|uniref:Collagenase n=1 Tax=Desulfosarcina ovata subsp. ovata TaxID=2752305 RepID=A0A5K8AC77_9BACT|nr:U32 family peptidase [Desulfosarcina ovata]BBO90141.1 collagenase [Desulfosarcina ovata subsp. ovata]